MVGIFRKINPKPSREPRLRRREAGRKETIDVGKPEYRIFNGVRYTIYAFRSSKREADIIANKKKKEGFYARVVKHSRANGYQVYINIKAYAKR